MNNDENTWYSPNGDPGDSSNNNNSSSNKNKNNSDSSSSDDNAVDPRSLHSN